MNCLFCQIAHGDINADILYEDDQILAFNDIRPRAPCHILIIPREHIATVNDLGTSSKDLIGHMILTAKNLANKQGIADEGYRLVFNCNANGGQEIYHIHLHLLGGRQMHWPPG